MGNRTTTWICTGWLLLLWTVTHAQLSPGPLIEAHAHLEGLSNCTQCHTLGKKVSNDKCLACHERIDQLVDQGRGYHASPEVVRQDCFACHSDHHGRSFDVIRFDIERFDHRTAGYPLTGAHAALDCRQCHTPDLITDPVLRTKQETFLGLETACITCHADFHQNTLAADCASCHNTEAFRPAAGFAHNETSFPLRGKHTDVACVSCHPMETRNGQEFQVFADVAFGQCSSCHSDPHQNRFGPDCKSCHTEESFFIFRGQRNFNHNTTGFPLRGQHQKIDCADCHSLGGSGRTAFTDFAGKDVGSCLTCHDDVHEGAFGEDCRQCHTEQSFFQIVGGTDRIDHNLTDFPLAGKHADIIDCRQCHSERLTEPVAFAQCVDCHEDYHEEQFVEADRTVTDCANCHTVDGFSGSTFTIIDHNASGFPLDGAHLATPCFACHLRDAAWTFRELGSGCVDCHTNVHGDDLIAYDPRQTCTGCHTTLAWSEVSFDHDLTGFQLEGAHAQTSCTACHEPEPASAGLQQQLFTGLDQDCARCHQNVHRDQFERNGITDCRRCHQFSAWAPSTFDHNTARFALEGAHVGVDCARCHQTVVDAGEPYTLYQTGRIECIDCHR
ncbi:MAG: cytochrome c3 family protein [Saprospiraceae bacterium]|nr:cytochrome c3 family protein [Saprospiraceae bacterium]